jgi:hypothetical protein
MSSPVSIATRKFQLQQNRGDPAWACKECQKSLMRIAVLDDYQSVALTMADWEKPLTWVDQYLARRDSR